MTSNGTTITYTVSDAAYVEIDTAGTVSLAAALTTDYNVTLTTGTFDLAGFDLNVGVVASQGNLIAAGTALLQAIGTETITVNSNIDFSPAAPTLNPDR